jgi:hypothetical protein
VLASVAAPGLVALVVMAGSPATAPGALARGRGEPALLTHCVKLVLGIGGRSAEPMPGSADPTVLSSLAVFRRARSARDALPPAAHLREALAAAGATTYDPSAAVRLASTGAHAVVYGVPAMMPPPAVPAGCGGLPQFAAVGPYLAYKADETGSGPGACLISTQLVRSPPTGLSLPGEAAPKPTRTLAVAGAVCRSEGVLLGYEGALADQRLGFSRLLALVPDGITSITYTLADGRRLTAPVEGNLVTPPAALSVPPTPHPVTAAELGDELAGHLPTTVTESGGASATATLNRPDSLIADAVGSFSFLRGLLFSHLSIGLSSSTSDTGASCSARTHRCVAVIVTTTCNGDERCRTTRAIHRYRYVTVKPPSGTTGPDTQPTAPIVGRGNLLITRPRKLTLVLSGHPHRRVVVLLSVNCFSRNAAASSGGPPLHLAVPSRTPIALPGPAHVFRACSVGALVISSRRGPVHVSAASG